MVIWQDIAALGRSAPSNERIDRVSDPLMADEGHWRVKAERGFWLVLSHAHSVYSIADFTGSQEQVDRIECNDRITIQFLIEGRIDMRLEDGTRYRFGDGRGAVFACPAGTRIERIMPARAPIRYVGISIPIGELSDGFGIAVQDLRPELRALANGTMARPLALEFHLSFGQRASIEALLDNRFTGRLRDRYLEARLVELTCLSIDWMLLDGQAGRPMSCVHDRESHALEHAAHLLSVCDGSPLAIAAIARRVGLNRNKLRLGFHDRYGVSPADFARRARLDHAARLVATSDLSIFEIANAVGFGSQSSFTRSFREAFGVSPSVHRRRSMADAHPGQREAVDAS